MKYLQGSFSVGGSASENHDKVFGAPLPATRAARLRGCTCESADTRDPQCPLHPSDVKEEHSA
jgi:hypothetical protein